MNLSATSQTAPALLRVLSDGTRLRALALLAREELSVGELSRCLAMTQSRVSNHLRVLREHDLLIERRSGTSTFLRAALGSGPADSAADRLWAAVAPDLAVARPDVGVDAYLASYKRAHQCVPAASTIQSAWRMYRRRIKFLQLVRRRRRLVHGLSCPWTVCEWRLRRNKLTTRQRAMMLGPFHWSVTVMLRAGYIHMDCCSDDKCNLCVILPALISHALVTVYAGSQGL